MINTLAFTMCAMGMVSTSTGFVMPSSTRGIMARPATFKLSTSLRMVNAVSEQTSLLPTADVDVATAVSTNTKGVSQAETEAARLRAMAAQLRSEAASLEEEQASFRAQESMRIFKSFDSDRNGLVDVTELRAGLEKLLKKTVQPERASQLLRKLDLNSDGVISPDEMLTAQSLRLRLDEIAKKEADAYRMSRELARQAKDIAEFEGARSALVNDKPSTVSDRIVSALPYLLPLSDGLLFGSFLLQGQFEAGNPVVVALLSAVALLRAVPFGQFAAFFGLSVLGDNLKVNKLVRHNALQAVYLDVALFPASLLTAAAAWGKLPTEILQGGSDVIFVALMAAIVYSITSSAAGVTPDKLPFISDIVQRRMDRISAREFDTRNFDDDKKQ